MKLWELSVELSVPVPLSVTLPAMTSLVASLDALSWICPVLLIGPPVDRVEPSSILIVPALTRVPDPVPLSIVKVLAVFLPMSSVALAEVPTVNTILSASLVTV